MFPWDLTGEDYLTAYFAQKHFQLLLARKAGFVYSVDVLV